MEIDVYEFHGNPDVARHYLQQIGTALERITGVEFKTPYALMKWLKEAESAELIIIETGTIVARVPEV